MHMESEMQDMAEVCKTEGKGQFNKNHFGILVSLQFRESCYCFAVFHRSMVLIFRASEDRVRVKRVSKKHHLKLSLDHKLTV